MLAGSPNQNLWSILAQRRRHRYPYLRALQDAACHPLPAILRCSKRRADTPPTSDRVCVFEWADTPPDTAGRFTLGS